jgi:hypothetical protein
MIMLWTTLITLSLVGVAAYWKYNVVREKWDSVEMWVISGGWSLLVHVGLAGAAAAGYHLYLNDRLSTTVLAVLGIVVGLIVTILPIRRYERLRNSH